MVDFNKKVYNVDKFRQAAIHFQKYGTYTTAPRGTTDYIKYWDEETDRCINGYVAPDGDAITGYHYFYLNYSPIMLLSEVEYTDRYGNKRTRRERVLDFPKFWDYDYYYFNAIEEAENQGKHMAVLKCRQRGYSFKGASMLVRNYELIPGSKNFAVASEQKFLIGDGLLTKAWQIMDFIDKNTAWSKQRLTSTRMERVSGFKITDEFGKQTEQGYLSSITGITLKNDPERLRGTRGKLVLFEEGGKFPNLETAWRIEQPAVETDDGVAFGLLIAFGCVCAGTRIWTSTGDCINVEDLKKDEGILGWDTYQAVQQKISHINPPSEKPCVRITTTSGRTLECSTDHPVLWSKPGLRKRVPGKRQENESMKSWLFHDAGKCKVGEQVGIIDSIPFFGTKQMWEPRVVGWLIGDGSYGYDKTPRLSNCDDEINNYILTHFDTADDRKPRLTKDGKLYRETRIKGICPRLRELGIYGQTKTAKRLPEHIHQYNAESLAELIGGIFDTDGYMAIDSSGRPRITLTQNNKEILQQISEVLLHFGVHCTISFIKTKNRVHESNGHVIRDGEGHWRLSILDMTSIGNFVRSIDSVVGYKQSAMDAMHLFTESHITHNHKYVSGIHAERITKIEYIGIRPIYNLTADCNHNYIANGIVTHNTGGTQGGSFDGLKNLFYNPKAFNVLSFPNIWDDGQEGTECGFFVPSWSNMSDDFMDEDGNSFKERAIEELVKQRNTIREGGATQQSIDRFISERPLKPQEAVLELGKNIFPRKLLMDQLTRIRTNKKLQNMKHIVDLEWDGNGGVKATEKKSGDITTYHLKRDDKPEGSVVIWEYPINDPPFGLYIGGCLTPGEKVQTQRGLISVENVKLDDLLLNKDGKYVPIKNIQLYDKVNEDTYKIQPFGSYRTTTFTKEHPIWTGNRGFVKASELTTDDWLEIPNVYHSDEGEYCWTAGHDERDRKLAYFYGLFTGDGFTNINGNSHDVYMSIGKNEKQLAEFYDSLILDLFDRKCIHVHKNKEQNRRFTHKSLVEMLDSSVGISAYTKRVPEWVKRGSYGVKVCFLQGFLDSDGSVFYDRGKVRVNFTSVNLELLEDIQDLLFGLEIRNSIVIHQKETTNKQGIHSLQSYRINIVKDDAIKLAFNPVFESRKIKLLRKSIPTGKSKSDIKFIGNSIWLRVKNIDKSQYTGTVYNFECDTHTFGCRCIMTHNCDPYAKVSGSKTGQKR